MQPVDICVLVWVVARKLYSSGKYLLICTLNVCTLCVVCISWFKEKVKIKS